MMVLTDVSINGRIGIHIIRNGSLKFQWYREGILMSFLVRYFGVFGDNFILTDDNCRPHHTGIANNFFNDEFIMRMTYSSVINPIGHV